MKAHPGIRANLGNWQYSKTCLFTVRALTDRLALTTKTPSTGGFVHKFTCVERPPGKRDQRPGNLHVLVHSPGLFDHYSMFSLWTPGYRTLSLSISVIVNAATEQFLNCLLSRRLARSALFCGEKFAYCIETCADTYDLFSGGPCVGIPPGLSGCVSLHEGVVVKGKFYCMLV